MLMQVRAGQLKKVAVCTSQSIMLLRSSSTPGLSSLVASLAPLPERTRELEVEADATIHAKSCGISTSLLGLSSPVSLHLAASDETCSLEGGDWDFEREIIPWPRFRRVQSENDLMTMAPGPTFSPAVCTVDALSRGEQADGWPEADSGTTPKRQWSRRLSLRRHSSLPALSSSGMSSIDSILDELQAPLPGLLETGSSEEESGEEKETEKAKSKTDDFLLNCVGNYEADDRCSNQASVSGRERNNLVMEDGEVYAMSVGTNGVPLVCNSRGCRPLHVSEKVGPMFIAGGFGIGTGGVGTKYGTGAGGNEDSSSVDAYYRRMLEADPGHPLLLRNYARYLYEVRRDFPRAEEYFERAILTSPDDAELRSQYANLIWEVHKDQDRACDYFEQAAQAAPDDCYILGSYAAFMWDAEEQDQDQNAVPAYKEIPFVGSSAATVSASA